METFGYLQTAEEFENSKSRELVCLQNGLSTSDLKSGQMMAVLVGTACSAAVLSSAAEAQAIPLFRGDSGTDVAFVQNLLTVQARWYMPQQLQHLGVIEAVAKPFNPLQLPQTIAQALQWELQV